MLESYEKAVQKVYESLDSCIIIGLTGRTGVWMYYHCENIRKLKILKNYL